MWQGKMEIEIVRTMNWHTEYNIHISCLPWTPDPPFCDSIIIRRYDLNGYVEELTALPAYRYGHICAVLPSTGVRSDFEFTLLVNAGLPHCWGICFGICFGFCIDPSPWGVLLDIHFFPSTSTVSCQSLDCRRKNKSGGWKRWDEQYLQSWGNIICAELHNNLYS